MNYKYLDQQGMKKALEAKGKTIHLVSSPIFIVNNKDGTQRPDQAMTKSFNSDEEFDLFFKEHNNLVIYQIHSEQNPQEDFSSPKFNL